MVSVVQKRVILLRFDWWKNGEVKLLYQPHKIFAFHKSFVVFTKWSPPEMTFQSLLPSRTFK